MSNERPRDDLDFHKIHLQGSSSSRSALLLQEALDTCSKASETGDSGQSSQGISALVGLLESILESQQSDSENALLNEESPDEALSVLQRFVSSPSSNQIVVELLSFELPKVVVKFAGVSDKCRQITEGIIDCLILACSPRDMLSILCEALDSLIGVTQVPIYFVLLLKGLSKVFLCITRHHVEQVKVALPIVLNVLHTVVLESDEKHYNSLCELFSAAIGIAMSIQAVCKKLEGRRKDELYAILGLYVFQNMALISRSNLAYKVSDCVPFVVELSHFLPFCGLSYLGLITGCNVDAITSAACGEDDDDFKNCFSFVMDGASLAVIWGNISGEVAKAAEEPLATVLGILQSNQTKRWQAVGMLTYILSSNDYPLEIKGYTVELLSNIMNVSVLEESNSDTTDLTSYMPSLFSALQAVERVTIYASDANLRKKAFAALKKVVLDIPCSPRFDMLKALITNNNSPSMIALLLDLVKEQVLTENRQRILPQSDETAYPEDRIQPISPFWSSNALELVELVLKPPNGGPPSLPEHSEPVLSALNLYRFILMIESAGQAKCSDVLSENSLQKAHTEWLLPLRTLVSGFEAENRKEVSSNFALDVICALNPVQLVLYHCIELVEDNLKSLK